jgi:hypothetical protein
MVAYPRSSTVIDQAFKDTILFRIFRPVPFDITDSSALYNALRDWVIAAGFQVTPEGRE